MKKKNTIIGACSLAVITIGIGIHVFSGTDTENKVQEEQQVETTASTASLEGMKPAATGITNISSVGASSVIDTMDTGNEQMAEVTGDVNYFNVGFADALESYHECIYNDDVTTEELYAYVKDMDIATQVVPEESIIAGYEKLGVSNATTYLNIREGASTSDKVIGKLPGYSACEILEEDGDWYKIKSGTVIGYVSAEYILTGYDANVKAKEKMTRLLEVKCDQLNVRESANVDCDIATKVSTGEHLTIVEEEKDGWWKAEINGLSGYVAAEYVEVVYTLPTAIEIKEVEEETNTVTSSGVASSSSQGGSSKSSSVTYTNLDSTVSQTAIDLINTAYQYLGNPYVYGGNSLTNGIDCSGFVKQIFAMYGYSLPRTSRQYVSVGTQVPISQIKAGDILIYKYGSSIGHVAIYIGNGKIIHAANESSGICIGNAYFVYPYMAVRVIK